MAAKPGTTDDLAGYLVSGYWRSTGAGAHQWDTASSNVVTVNLTGLDAAGQALARAALAAWESVADLDFREVTGRANIGFDDSGTTATSSVPYDPRSGDIASATVYVGSSWLGRYGSTVGTYGYQTYLHEIGHALGLGHSSNYGTSGATYANATWTNDSWQQSVMSYLDQDENPNITAAKAYVVTPMMADIIAIQSMYGAARGTPTAGDTTYGEGSALGGAMGSVFGSGPGSLAANALTIWDEGGTDTFAFTATSARQTINLNAGSFSSVYGQTDNVAIARGTAIEWAFGGSGTDDITGNALANRLNGNAGADVIRGNAGADAISGGDGNDRLDGGTDGDTLFGGLGDDSLDGLQGTDTLWGGQGRDVLSGGTESDVLSGDGDGDRLSGGDGADTLFGGNGGDVLKGGTGSDLLDGGGGADVLDGEGGDDRMAGGAGADVFRLRGGGALDDVTDFANDVDTLLFDSSLWGGGALGATGILRFASLVGRGVAFTFAGGETVRVWGVTDLASLRDDIAFF